MMSGDDDDDNGGYYVSFPISDSIEEVVPDEEANFGRR